MATILELIKFLIARKKIWLLPSIFIIVIFGFLIILSQGSVLAPFIYTLF